MELLKKSKFECKKVESPQRFSRPQSTASHLFARTRSFHRPTYKRPAALLTTEHSSRQPRSQTLSSLPPLEGREERPWERGRLPVRSNHQAVKVLIKVIPW